MAACLWLTDIRLLINDVRSNFGFVPDLNLYSYYYVIKCQHSRNDTLKGRVVLCQNQFSISRAAGALNKDNTV